MEITWTYKLQLDVCTFREIYKRPGWSGTLCLGIKTYVKLLKKLCSQPPISKYHNRNEYSSSFHLIYQQLLKFVFLTKKTKTYLFKINNVTVYSFCIIQRFKKVRYLTRIIWCFSSKRYKYTASYKNFKIVF